MGMQEPTDEGHHVIFHYLKGIWDGAQPDPEFEGRSLNEDLGLDSLGLAELFFALSEELELPTERIVRFLRIGVPGGGDQEVANLVERIAILSRGGASESQRAILLQSGVVGDPGELLPIAPLFDNVGFVVKYCNAIKSLKSAKNHDVIDADHGDGAAMIPWQYFFSLNGRITRTQYWLDYHLSLLACGFVLVRLLGMEEDGSNAAWILYAIFFTWFGLAVSVKRWHDRDKSGWWNLILVVPLFGAFWALVEQGFLRGTRGPNRFGPDPLNRASGDAAEGAETFRSPLFWKRREVGVRIMLAVLAVLAVVTAPPTSSVAVGARAGDAEGLGCTEDLGVLTPQTYTSGSSRHHLRIRTWVTASNHRRITAPHTRTFNHGAALGRVRGTVVAVPTTISGGSTRATSVSSWSGMRG